MLLLYIVCKIKKISTLKKKKKKKKKKPRGSVNEASFNIEKGERGLSHR